MSFRLTGIGHPTIFDLLGQAPFLVGRATTTDCPVIDPTVSRQHAELRMLTRHRGVDHRAVGRRRTPDEEGRLTEEVEDRGVTDPGQTERHPGNMCLPLRCGDGCEGATTP